MSGHRSKRLDCLSDVLQVYLLPVPPRVTEIDCELNQQKLLFSHLAIINCKLFTMPDIAPPLGVGWGYGIVLGLGGVFAFGMVSFPQHLRHGCGH